jgi:2,4-dienoyl-CoA reductase-like NADH-dependent reductase (Old Yellow Enzyme family)
LENGYGVVDEPQGIVIGPLPVSSRYFLAAVNTGLASDGSPTPRLIEFHENRSGSSIGISYVGNVAVSRDVATNSGTLYFGGPSEPWNDLVAAIRARGSVPGIQLAARLGTSAAPRRWALREPKKRLEEFRDAFSSLLDSSLYEIVRAFSRSARTAAGFGFGAIQIHAAHGYLLSQSLNAEINYRTGMLGRPGFLVRQVVEAVRAAAPGAIVDVRLSLTDFHDATREAVLGGLIESGPDLISVSSGSYESSRSLIYPSRRAGENVYLGDVLPLCSRWPKQWWNVAGNIRRIPPISSAPKNLTFALGRPLIADPEFVAKHLAGEVAAIRECQWTGRCHYYTRGTRHIECPQSLDLPPPT